MLVTKAAVRCRFLAGDENVRRKVERRRGSWHGYRAGHHAAGFSERDAKRFESQLREMGVLIYVACAERAHAAWAVEILRRTGAEEPGLLEQEAYMAAAV